MAHFIIKSEDYEHIQEKSAYNYNYYRHKGTLEVILEIFHEDDNYAEYHNLGLTPSFSKLDFQYSSFIGNSCGDYIGGNNNVFDIDTEWT